MEPAAATCFAAYASARRRSRSCLAVSRTLVCSVVDPPFSAAVADEVAAASTSLCAAEVSALPMVVEAVALAFLAAKASARSLSRSRFLLPVEPLPPSATLTVPSPSAPLRWHFSPGLLVLSLALGATWCRLIDFSVMAKLGPNK